MQESLFANSDDAHPVVSAAATDPGLGALATALPSPLRLGTSSWNYPGWASIVWDRAYPAALLSREGLDAYAKHPLFRTVSLDRSFYRPLTAEQYSAHALQVPEDFRFVVKAPGQVTDALLRDASGQGKQLNPDFLDSRTARRDFVEPAQAGLGAKLGALVFQISPLPHFSLGQMSELIARLHQLLQAIPDLRAVSPDAVVAVEVRNPHWLVPAFTEALRDTRATYCMGLHAKMPPIAEQLPILRALWPGPLVCRWNLHPRHGAFGYEEARRQYAPFDSIVDADVETREALARVIAGTVGAGQPAYVTVSNKAEGCAPLSVAALAQAVVEIGRAR